MVWFEPAAATASRARLAGAAAFAGNSATRAAGDEDPQLWPSSSRSARADRPLMQLTPRTTAGPTVTSDVTGSHLAADYVARWLLMRTWTTCQSVGRSEPATAARQPERAPRPDAARAQLDGTMISQGWPRVLATLTTLLETGETLPDLRRTTPAPNADRSDAPRRAAATQTPAVGGRLQDLSAAAARRKLPRRVCEPPSY